MNFLQKIQQQPEWVRKTILWAIVVIIGLGLLVWWLRGFNKKFHEFSKQKLIEEMHVSSFKNKFEGIEIPSINQEDLKKLEELYKTVTSSDNESIK